jgi:hypothetical protein
MIKYCEEATKKIDKFLDEHVNYLVSDPNDPRVGILARDVIRGLFINELTQSFQQGQKQTIKEIKEKLNPGLKELLPVMDKTHQWFRAHEEMGAEIVFVKREDVDGMVREIPVKAIYESPLVKFQSVSHLEDKGEA